MVFHASLRIQKAEGREGTQSLEVLDRAFDLSCVEAQRERRFYGS